MFTLSDIKDLGGMRGAFEGNLSLIVALDNDAFALTKLIFRKCLESRGRKITKEREYLGETNLGYEYVIFYTDLPVEQAN